MKTINKNIAGIFPLTPLQEGMYFHHLLEGEEAFYVEQNVLRFQEPVKGEAVRFAQKLLGYKHEILNIAILSEGLKEPKQVILRNKEMEFTEIDLSQEQDPEAAGQEFINQDYQRGFNFSKDSLMRMTLLRLSQEESLLVWTFHHILMDGWCLSILSNDFFRFLAAYGHHSEEAMKELIDGEIAGQAKYSDYLRWLSKQDTKASLAYWEKLVSGLKQSCLPDALPFSGHGKEEVSLTLKDQLFRQLEDLASDRGCTMSNLVESALAILLHRLSLVEDIAFGKVVSGRDIPLPAIENTLGLFINTIPVVSCIQAETSLSEVLDKITEQSLAGTDHHYCSLANIQALAKHSTNIADVVYSFENYYVKDSNEAEASAAVSMESFREATSSPVTILAYGGDFLTLKAMVNPKIYHSRQWDRYLTYLTQILEAMAQDLTTKVEDLSFIGEPEQWSGQEDRGHENPLAELKNICQMDSNRIMLAADNLAYTRHEVWHLAEGLAGSLRSKGVVPGDLVPILLANPADQLIAMIGVGLAGASHLVMDPKKPSALLKKLSLQSGACCLIAEEAKWGLPEVNFKTMAKAGQSLGEVDVNVDRFCFVETCGELTEIDWRDLKDSLLDLRGTPLGGFLQCLPLNSLAGLRMAWSNLLSGMALNLTDTGRTDRAGITDWLAKHSVQAIGLTCRNLEALTESDLEGMDLIWTVAGPMSRSLGKYCSQDRQIISEYNLEPKGVYGLTWRKQVGEPSPAIIPAGRPSKAGWAGIRYGEKDCPWGLVGEIIYQPTGEGDLTGQAVQRTGDLGRLLPDGSLQYLGSQDQLVAHKGKRLALWQIESALRQVPGIKDAAVALVKDKFLVAWLIPGEAFVIDEARRELAKSLPDHMMPTHWIPVSDLVKDDRGQIILEDLPQPEEEAETSPMSRMEEIIAQAYCEILEVDQIGAKESFFDRGGHSLLAIRLVNRLEKALSQKLSLKLIYEYPVVRDLANHLSHQTPDREEAIPTSGKKEAYDMTSPQKRLFFIQNMEKDSVAYNMQVRLDATGLSFDQALKILDGLSQRHEMLRVVFSAVDDHYRYRVLDSWTPEMTVIDGSFELSDLVRPFDLTAAPPWRAFWFEEDGSILLDFHHIITDGLSLDLIQKEFADLKSGQALDPLPISYHDYSQWLNSRDIKVEEKYWQEQLAGDLPILDLMEDYPRPQRMSYRGRTLNYTLAESLRIKLSQRAKDLQVSEFVLLLGALYITLGKFSGEDEFIIGTPVAGRNRKELEGLFGMFVNTLPLRAKVDKKMSVDDWLKDLRATLLNALDHEAYPFEDMVSLSDIPRSLNRNPLFDGLFTVTDHSGRQLSDEEREQIERIEDVGISKFDFSLSVFLFANGLGLSWQYSTDLYKEDSVRRWMLQWEESLIWLLSAKDKPLEACPLAGPLVEEARAFIPEPGHPLSAASLAEVFRHRVEATPDLVAIHGDEDSWTFRHWDEIASSMAWAMKERGANKGDVVAIMVRSRFEVLAAMTACMKSGLVFLPMNPDHPLSRNQQILADARPVLVWGFREDLAKQGMEGLVFEAIEACSKDFPAVDIDPEDPLYIIYTSGTTGMPKGVVNCQRGIIHLMDHLQRTWPMKEEDLWLQKTELTFDVFLTELFWGWWSGSGLVLYPHGVRGDTRKIAETIRAKGITHINFAPSLLSEFLSNLEDEGLVASLKVVISAGEELANETARRFMKRLPTVTLINGYGPTETSVYASLEECRQDLRVSIGKGYPGTPLQVMQGDQEVGVAMPGELMIGGRGLALGYYQDATRTEEAFVNRPEVGRLYHSGDRVRRLADGRLEFLGRLDHQVKLRGHRIELGEIQNALLTLPGVSKAAALVKGKGSDAALLGFVQAQRLPADWRNCLRRSLPVYMIPSKVTALPSLPLSASGKVDLKALAQYESKEDKVVVEAGNDQEEKVIAAVRKVLRTKEVSILDDFFALGGHSLKGVNLLAELEKTTGVRLPLTALFNHPCLRDLAEAIGTSQGCALEKAQCGPDCEMSPAQSRMYLLQAIDPDSLSYHLPLILSLDPEVGESQVRGALSQLIQRHEALRTSFHIIGDQSIQRIHESAPLDFEVVHAKAGQLRELQEDFVAPMNLAQPGLMRCRLLRLEDQVLLFWDMHHIIADGITQEILVSEFSRLLKGEVLAEPLYQYRDFSQWAKQQDLEKDKAFWLDLYKDIPEPLDLATDFPRPAMQSYEGDLVRRRLSSKISQQIKELSHRTGATPYMILLSAFTCLLHHYSNQEDLVVGTPVSGRTHPDAESIVGMFVNTLPLRFTVGGDQSFLDHLMKVRNHCLAAFSHQGLPFDDLVSALPLRKDPSRNALFDVFFNLQVLDGAETTREEEACQADLSDMPLAKFDLSFDVVMAGEGVDLSIEYATKLFRRESMEIFLEQYVDLLTKALAFPELPLVDQVPQVKQLAPLAGKRTGNIIDCFRQQCQERPDQVALTMADESYSYSQLLERSRSMAGQLQAAGVRPGDRVGLYLTRSPEMIIAILGILAAGAAYVPMDKRYPEERLAYIREDAEISVLVTDEELSQAGLTTLKVDPEARYEYTPVAIEPDAIAYLIYTSGSTGRPKGVMVKHHNVLHLVEGYHELYEMVSDDVVLQFASISFDQSVWDIFASLLKGLTLCLLPEDLMVDPAGLAEYVGKMGVTVMALTPALLRELDEKALPGLRLIESGGAAAQGDVLRRFLSQGMRVFNTYGPTEATVNAISYEMTGREVGSRIPIGRSMPGSQALIIKEGRPVDRQIPGELCLVGENVAAGYHNREDLTQDRFVPSPLGEGRMYRTGDLARVNCLGEIEFLGRLDDQVKLRGFRIELGEIEALLSELPGVDQVAVVVQGGETGRLVAYLVAEADARADWQAELAKSLPPYMIPTDFVLMDRMPLNNSGKIDRKKLPAVAEAKKSLQKPKTPAEEQVARCFAEALDQTEVGRDESFFDLGGHSITAIRLVSLLEQAFGRRLTLKEIFQRPRVCDLAQALQDQTTEKRVILPVGPKESYPIHPSQKRMYLIQSLDESSVTYNMPGSLPVDGYSAEEIRQAMQILANRHVLLRTSFHEEGGEIVQKVKENLVIPIEQVSLAKEDRELAFKEFVQPFDLSLAPICRCRLVNLGNSRELWIDCHHIISDGVSSDILARDLRKILEGEVLPEKKLDYLDYAEWINQQDLSEERAYWQEKLKGLQTIDLPLDHARLPRPDFRGGLSQTVLPRDLTQKLSKLAKAWQVTEYQLLSSLVALTLGRFANSRTLTLGTPHSGRDDFDLDDVVGMFVNTLCLHFKMPEEMSLQDYVKASALEITQAMAMGTYPFDRVVEDLQETRDLTRNPFFDVMFTWHDYLSIPSEEYLKVAGQETVIARFDMSFNALRFEDQVVCQLEYQTALYEAATADKFLDFLLQSLEKLVENPDIKLGAYGAHGQVMEGAQLTIEGGMDKRLLQVLNQSPQEIALVYGREEITYEDLFSRAWYLSHELIQQGIQPEEPVLLLASQSRDAVIGMLAILFAGGAYVPLDPRNPSQRQEIIIRECQARFAMVSSDQDLPGLINIKMEEGRREDPPAGTRRGQSLSYIMYTSGSTGIPKGTMIEDRSILRLVDGLPEGILFKGVQVLQAGSAAFDAATFEIFGPLCHGGTIRVLEELSSDQLARQISEQAIDTMWLTAAVFNQFIDEDPSVFKGLKNLLIGGQKLSESHVHRFLDQFGHSIRLFNGYGPTEATTFTTLYAIEEKEDPIPIGQPIAETDLMVLQGEWLCPPGVIGELCIGGIGLARGYLNVPQLNEDRFPLLHGKKIYRTGDLVRIRPDNNLEYFGRMDHQIKVRGFRVELGEIESALKECPGIEDAAVIYRPRQEVLAAYWTGPEDWDGSSLREALKKKLPDYMVPASFRKLDNLPVTINGKLDRQRLMELTPSQADVFQPPEGEKQEVLAAVLEEIFPTGPISFNESFQSLGGNSIKAIGLRAKLRERGWHLPMEQLYRAADLARLADQLRRSVLPGHVKRQVELTMDNFLGEWTEGVTDLPDIQKSSWQQEEVARHAVSLRSQTFLTDPRNVISFSLHFSTDARPEDIQASIFGLIHDHQVLRCAYDEKLGRWVEYDLSDFNLPIHDQVSTPAALTALSQPVFKFDGQEILHRMAMIREESQWQLLVMVHHGLWDNLSSSAFANSLKERLKYGLKAQEGAVNDYFGTSQEELDFSKSFPWDEFDQARQDLVQRAPRRKPWFMSAVVELTEQDQAAIRDNSLDWILKTMEKGLILRSPLDEEFIYPMVLNHHGRSPEQSEGLGLYLDAVPYLYQQGDKQALEKIARSSINGAAWNALLSKYGSDFESVEINLIEDGYSQAAQLEGYITRFVDVSQEDPGYGITCTLFPKTALIQMTVEEEKMEEMETWLKERGALPEIREKVGVDNYETLS